MDYRGQTTTPPPNECARWNVVGEPLDLTTETYPEPDLGTHKYCRNPGGMRDTAYCLPVEADDIDDAFDCNLTPNDTCHQGKQDTIVNYKAVIVKVKVFVLFSLSKF